ncbi:MAG: acyl-CoA dehydrogenase family protein [Gemmatimonadetes bacterium]|nr:acyl-CoA dehydrogenase family protein [Gemmatimonadota bacterium]MBK6457744.1 acyl-CoA dehydrogenase family protein [Gemmatimonadota bacterium]MBK7833540.1 acyl-CoA dehydrogenase family protein [Gemmatimonadota bacterium]MBK8060944.1 acyl-CoA dehydrogenase family protein [Gemmatimonadota bacterium]MBK9407220.1 acyl-CoA dehydrogenase family protein [Gemmatimonadota bacterium]
MTAPLTTFSEDELLFRDAVAAFADEEVRPLVAEMERNGKVDSSIIAKVFELGLMGIEVDEAHGGAGGSLMMVALAVEELSKVDASAAILVDVQNTLVEYPLRTYGTDAQKAEYLTRLTAGTVGSYALSEAGSGSDAFALATRAERDGDDWVLNGRKLWITNGAEAGIYIVFANANPTAGYKGITAFIVEREFPGFAVGKKEDKLGIRASSTVELLLDNCRVPNANVLGTVGQGYKIAIDTLNVGRIGIGAQMIGVAQGALAAATAYLKERRQFGKALAEFQGIQFQVAQAATEVEAARLMVYNAARLKDAGHDIAREGAMAKLFSSQVCERTTSLCVELLGGYGYTKDYPVEKFYRDAKIGTIYEGTSNMQLQTIAKAVLK